MIGGINASTPSLYQAGNNSPARERANVSRPPEADSQAFQSGDADTRYQHGAVLQSHDTAPGSLEQPGGTGPELGSRSVESPYAAEDTRFERFRADELSLSTARALSAFAGVAAAGQEFESGSVLTGIDILV